MEEFSVLEYKLGNIHSNLELMLDKGHLRINTVRGRYGKSSYKGSGLLDFSKGKIDLRVHFKNSHYQDVFHIYNPLLKNLNNFPRDLNCVYNTSYKVFGKLSKKKIHVEGTVKGKNIFYRGERADSFSGSFKYANNRLSITKAKIKKNKGILEGKFTYHFPKKDFEYTAKLKGLRLKDLNIYNILSLGYDSHITGKFKGERSKKNFSSQSDLTFTDGSISNISTPDTYISLSNESFNLYLRGNLIGNMITFNSYMNLSSEKESFLNVAMMVDDFKILSGVFSSHNIDDKYLHGLMSAKLNTQFKLNDLSKLNLSFFLDEFQFRKGEMHLVGGGNNKILIKKGKIDYWDIVLGGRKGKIQGLARGDFSKDYEVTTDFDLDISVLEIISKTIEKAEGSLKGVFSIIGNVKDHAVHFDSSGEISFLKIAKVPRFFSDISYKAIANGNELLVQKFKGKYGKGLVDVEGNIILDLPFPKLNLNYSLNNAFIPLIKKSGLVVSGNGDVTGLKIPYLISGQFSVLHGEVLDEFHDISSNNNNDREVIIYKKFIREKEFNFNRKINYLTSNIDVNFANHVDLKNSVAELKFEGDINLKGPPGDLLFNGLLKIIPIESKFIFKGHEFSLSRGEINFRDSDGRKRDSLVNFSGKSEINEYLVTLNLQGSTRELEVELGSRTHIIPRRYPLIIDLRDNFRETRKTSGK